MKPNNIKSLLALLILFAFFTGCINSANPSPAFSDKTNIPMVVTSSPLQESTQTPIPILHTVTAPTKDDYTYLINLLNNNGNCHLPCFWGITPGKSVFEEAKSILLPLNNISDSLNFNSIGINNVSAVYKEKDLGVYLHLNFGVSEKNIVTWMFFGSRVLRELNQGNYEEVFNHPLYNQMLRFYSMPNVLSVYGEPTSILLRTNSEQPPQIRGNFDILLAYPERGTVVHYNMPMYIDETKIAGCPENSTIELYLVDPSGILSSSELLKIYSDAFGNSSVGYKFIGEVNSLSVSEFVQIFNEPSNKCIETPATHWPPP